MVGGSDSDPPPKREALIDEAVALFGAKYGRPVSRDDAARMMDRLTAFFSILAEWHASCADGQSRAA